MLEKAPRVCLIVDNPLRDLEGLVLLAWQLACAGARSWLVPMYDQGFDVPALKPDLVLVNYTRANNSDLIKTYKNAGILVGVLDTEGIAGKSSEHFAEMVASANCGRLVDLYCVWGESQYRAFIQKGTVPQNRLHVTGCPRYYYCAAPWRSALPVPGVRPGYVLINTNFPTVNPRFSSGPKHEIASMVKAGFSETFALQFIHDAGEAHRTLTAVAIQLAKLFPSVRFVLRPHPFERIAAYDELARLPNVEVRQEGTSLEWIASSRLLLHQNCSTAVEAAMLGVEAIALEWFNTPALRLDAATGVSRIANGEDDLIRMLGEALENRLPPAPFQVLEFRKKVFRELYFAIDGAATKRIADAILHTIRSASLSAAAIVASESPSIRGRFAHLTRTTLGYRTSGMVRRIYANRSIERRRIGKAFPIELVEDILNRIQAVASADRRWIARPATETYGRASRMLGGSSVELVEAS
ncbi:MAG: surface carbohydrate biosynthesis protein [Hyphomicrobiaceae bacterium]